jgi:RNA polymerase sigma-70 factor (ECF subfamily)
MNLATVVEMRQSVLLMFDQHYHQVVRFVMICGAGAQDAEDAAQEAFIEALRRADDGRWEAVREPEGWLRRVALRRYQRLIKRNPVAGSLAYSNAQPSREDDPSDLAPATLDVLSALRRLDPSCRAVMAFHLDGFSGTETAAHLGITGQQARDLLKKARRELRRDLRAGKEEER